jgi:hypothetical protein
MAEAPLHQHFHGGGISGFFLDSVLRTRAPFATKPDRLRRLRGLALYDLELWPPLARTHLRAGARAGLAVWSMFADERGGQSKVRVQVRASFSSNLFVSPLLTSGACLLQSVQTMLE